VIVIHSTGERRPTASLLPYARNSRDHSEAQIEEIVHSMQEWGFTMPVLIDPDGEIVAGHGRVMAANLLELPECPVIVAKGWTEAQKRAYCIADNKIPLNATWNARKLAAELQELAELNFDLSLTGFSDKEMLDLTVELEPEPERTRKSADDAVAALPEASTTRRGDVWILGAHRVACGNPLQHETMQALLQGMRAQLVVTAPAREEDDVEGLVRIADEYSTGWLIVWIDWHETGRWLQAARGLGPPSSMLVWPKGGGGLGDVKRTFSSDFELGLVWHRGAELVGRRVGSVWKVAKDTGGAFASARQRPVALAVQAIEKTTAEGDLVLDLAGREGSTLIACEKTGRAARLVEVEGRFVDAIVQRWEDFSGQQAQLEATGQAWAAVEAERRRVAGSGT
jgi:ParB-like chromosome segregation protein Spo0J